jgi:hypothetical protein
VLNECSTARKHSVLRITVKVHNFGPHGNFGPLFQMGLLSLKRVLQKNEKNECCYVVETLLMQKFGSDHFWYMTHQKKVRNLKKKKVQCFHEIQS